MKRLTRQNFLALATLFSCLLTASFIFFAQAATLIDDNFADGVSTNQDLANNSLAIYKARSATIRNDTAGSVEFDMTATGTSSDAFWAYFTEPNSPVTLQAGDRLSFSGTFSLQGASTTGADIRFGLLNSNGSRRAADLTGGQNAPEFGDDTGYAAQFYASGSGTPFVLYRRDVTNPPITNIFNSFSNAGFTVLPGSGATARQSLINDVPYTFTYTVERLSSTQTQVTVAVTGGTLSGLTYTALETTQNPNTSFDWFTFRIGGTNFAQKIKFTRFLVDFSPAAPVITTQPSPASQIVSVGSNVQFSVAASGSGLSYQWLKDGAPITDNASAMTATLQLSNVQTSDSGVYTVLVSNSNGSVTSNAVNLTVTNGPVDPPPVIDQQPENTVATVGSPASLSVTATGVNLSYQWFKNGILINGATASTLDFPSVQNSDTGDYTVIVSNQFGSVTSSSARLTVVSTIAATAFSPNDPNIRSCTDTPLTITFNQALRVGNTGRIRVYSADGILFDTIDLSASPQTKNFGGLTVNYYPIIVNGNTASIYVHQQLARNQTYYVTIEPGVITDTSNVPFSGFSDTNTWRFTTKAAAPAAESNLLTVAADNSGDFCTVQGAIDFVPANNTERVIINVKNGVYTEIVYIPATKPFITVRGENRDETSIQYANNNNLSPSTQGRAMFGVEAADFNLENITLHNTTPQGGSQAEALRTNGLRANIIRVNLKSFQDTLLTQKSTFVTDSYIEGDVDFMWGNGASYFKNTELKMLRENLGYYTQIRNGSTTQGNIYVNCRLTRGAGVTNGSYLSRIDPDDYPYSQVVFIDSQMDSHIIPVAWRFDNPTNPVTESNYPNIRFWEYNTTDLDGNPVDCSQRHPISRNSCNNPLTEDEANFYRSAINVINFTPQEKLTAIVSLSNSTHTYDGTAKTANATTDPAGLSVDITYNGSSTPPVNPGTYTVVATVNDPNYTGTATAFLHIRAITKAFPGAEGAGAYSIGGRGGDVYHVTNLNDSGPGSLREGVLTANAPRTIVFDVSGTINLNSRLNINKSFLTIAGQTAPGDGVTIAGWTTVVTNAQHVIMRYLRFRTGDIRCSAGMDGDSLWVDRSRDVMIDHVSASWSIDESLSVTDSDRVTVQWSNITESLNQSCHPEGRHGYGSLIRYGNGRISYHHNLYAHHFNRNPRVGDNITLDFVNNVIYDWGTDASYSGAANEGTTKVNYIGNYLVAGPNTQISKRARAFNGGSLNTLIYQSGNVIDGNFNGVRDGVNTGWVMFVNLYTQQTTPFVLFENQNDTYQIGITVEEANTAYDRVLEEAGNSLPRDAVDSRIRSEVQSEIGIFVNSQNEVGGYPALASTRAPRDTDRDGLPDILEILLRLNPFNPRDASAITRNGYTNLENYTNTTLILIKKLLSNGQTSVALDQEALPKQ